MLRTAQYAWQQEALSENARAVFELGRELYDRLSGLGRHVDGLGKALTNAVSSYNKTIGSLEGRVLVSARKLNQMGVVDAELTAAAPVEETVRALSAPDLLRGAPEFVCRNCRAGRKVCAATGARASGDGRGWLRATRRGTPRKNGRERLPQRAWPERAGPLEKDAERIYRGQPGRKARS